MSDLNNLIKNFYRKIVGFLSLPRVIAVFIAIGIIVRAKQYLANCSFWMDETWVAAMIISQSPAELIDGSGIFSELPTTPLGFMLIAKAFTMALGNSELVLRLFPFLCSIAALFVFNRFSRRVLPLKEAAVATGLFAFSPILISYAAELKQYSSDLFIVLLFYYYFVFLLDKKILFRNFFILAFAGSVAMWISNTCVFVLAAGGITLSVASLVKKQGKRFFVLIGVYAIWILNFAVLYKQKLAPLVGEESLVATWPGAFASNPILSFENLFWAKEVFVEMFKDLGGFILPSIAAILFIVGLVSLFLKKKYQAMLFALPVVLAFMAAVFQKYPFRERVILFLVPCVLIFVVQGVAFFVAKTKKFSLLVFAVFVVFLFFNPVRQAIKGFSLSPCKQDLRAMMEFFNENYQPEDAIFLDSVAQTSSWYYGDLLGFNKRFPETLSFKDPRDGRVSLHEIGKFHIGYKTIRGIDLLIYRQEFNVYNTNGDFRGARVRRGNSGKDYYYILENIPHIEPIKGKRVWLMFGDSEFEKMADIAKSSFDKKFFLLKVFEGKGAKALLYDTRVERKNPTQ
ncbi:MAG: glycosyltransferase family 39 protein [Candidatus Aceula meridiana]|nr:glycosyltransferase family 39 protein [Candidatus Aceula meridiana]